MHFIEKTSGYECFNKKKFNITPITPKYYIMKSRNFLILTLALGLVAVTSAHKVTICHNANKKQVTIEVALPAAAMHYFLHGDTKGSCSDASSSVER